eukprot:12313296-Heterocapsa_arctica.AAC.1
MAINRSGSGASSSHHPQAPGGDAHSGSSPNSPATVASAIANELGAQNLGGTQPDPVVGGRGTHPRRGLSRPP